MFSCSLGASPRWQWCCAARVARGVGLPPGNVLPGAGEATVTRWLLTATEAISQDMPRCEELLRAE